MWDMCVYILCASGLQLLGNAGSCSFTKAVELQEAMLLSILGDNQYGHQS